MPDSGLQFIYHSESGYPELAHMDSKCVVTGGLVSALFFLRERERILLHHHRKRGRRFLGKTHPLSIRSLIKTLKRVFRVVFNLTVVCLLHTCICPWFIDPSGWFK
tara:strand:- start:316 stop:633 length:318 start_codon:yes stop_codon:yes gene_type:complete